MVSWRAVSLHRAIMYRPDPLKLLYELSAEALSTIGHRSRAPSESMYLCYQFMKRTGMRKCDFTYGLTRSTDLLGVIEPRGR